MKPENLPALCPRCGRTTAWSPLRVWCVSCSFQMAARKYESQADLLERWNAAVRDGEDYAELIRENADREAKKNLETRREKAQSDSDFDLTALFA